MSLERPLSSSCNTEKSVVPSAAGTTTSPSMTAEPALRCHASAAILRKRLVQSMPRRVNEPGNGALMPVGRLANSRLLSSVAELPSREHRPNQILPQQNTHHDRAQHVQQDKDHNGI